MKKIEMTSELAEKLLVEPNKEYMFWANADEITLNELIVNFHLEIREDSQIDCVHNIHDFRIEDVEFDDAIY